MVLIQEKRRGGGGPQTGTLMYCRGMESLDQSVVMVIKREYHVTPPPALLHGIFLFFFLFLDFLYFFSTKENVNFGTSVNLCTLLSSQMKQCLIKHFKNPKKPPI